MTKEEIMAEEGWTEEEYYDYLNAMDDMWYSWEAQPLEEDQKKIDHPHPVTIRDWWGLGLRRRENEAVPRRA